ncbi:TPA: DUF4277 domain-containing protein [Salmonella enterica subsp. enterica serovar Muenchen]|nr:DUF4277 domain-containing protein [Salmonella enterica]EHI5301842.1 DUF4277 domain-containing protein [Salmonella enterica]EKS2302560.1 DUF4277 domain-containing protein [Salmonella enterica]HBM0024293.1 DUF4277 domain-containing protein [Salmonella enterica subsp. enterica serovar Muenchen]
MNGDDCHISHGHMFVAMLLNGPGFYSRILHTFPLFIVSKPAESLTATGIKADALSVRCRDDLSES